MSAAKGLHPFIFVAQQLKRIGCNECGTDAHGELLFRTPLHLDSYLALMATVVNSDGSLNCQSPFAERFALCLEHSGNGLEALELFIAVMDGKPAILLAHESLQIRRVDISPFADTSGKLGRIAMQRFGELAMQHDRRDLAIRLFSELAEKIPADTAVMSLIDARVRTLQSLEELKVETLRYRASVTKELKRMKGR